MTLTASVALCTYNGAEYIEEQIASILRQSTPVREIVVADDGSTDRTLEKVTSALADSDIRMVILGPGNRPFGVQQNFQRAIRQCTSDVVLLADQDDVWEETRVEVALSWFERDLEAQLVACNTTIVSSEGARLGTLFDRMRVSDSELEVLNRDALAILVRRSIFPGMSMAMRREFALRHTPIARSWPHDYWFSVNAALEDGFRAEVEPLVRYRQHSTNVVGVAPGGVRARIVRLLRTGSDSVRLAEMFNQMVDAAADRPSLPREKSEVLLAKASFEEKRSAFSRRFTKRSMQALKLAATPGTYSRFSSNGRLHLLRDLLKAPLAESRYTGYMLRPSEEG